MLRGVIEKGDLRAWKSPNRSTFDAERDDDGLDISRTEVSYVLTRDDPGKFRHFITKMAG